MTIHSRMGQGKGYEKKKLDCKNGIEGCTLRETRVVKPRVKRGQQGEFLQ